MKRCPQCQGTFSDENFFCLSDGTPLPPPFDSSGEVTFVRNATEQETFVRNAPEEATVVRGAPFAAPPAAPAAARQGVSPAFAYLAVGMFVLLLIGGAGILFLLLKSNSSDTKASSNSKNTVVNSFSNFSETTPSKSSPTREPDSANLQKSNLEEQQAALEREKQKLADERRALDAQKTKPVEPSTYATPPPPPAVQPTARISFSRGSSQSTVSGTVASQRSYVLAARSGQYLSASVSSGGGCVTFTNGSTGMSYTTGGGDNRVTLVNKCGSQSSFSLTVSIR